MINSFRVLEKSVSKGFCVQHHFLSSSPFRSRRIAKSGGLGFGNPSRAKGKAGLVGN